MRVDYAVVVNRRTLIDAAGRRYIRRIVVSYKLHTGDFGTFVAFSTHKAPVLHDKAIGPINCGLAWRRWAEYLGGEIVSIDARDIGGIDDEIDKAEFLYRDLMKDANDYLP